MERQKRFGGLFKEKRMELDMTLRQFCEKHKLDPGNISKLERGILSPPKEKILNKYAKCLELKEGTDDWYDFFDLACVETGRIPNDITEKEVAHRLPLLFRTIRGKKISKEKFNKLIKIIKES